MSRANEPEMTAEAPLPADDWVEQQQLAEIFGVTPKTVSLWAGDGKLRRYEHGMPNCGRRKYSRSLVLRDIELHWREALSRLTGNEEATNNED